MRNFRLVLPLLAFGASAGPAASPAHPLEGLATRAEVTGPRGRFVTEMVSLPDGITRFVQIYPPDDPRGRDRIELLVAGGDRAFQRDAKGAFIPADAGTRSFVAGHDAVRLASAKDRPPTLSLAAGTGGGEVTIALADYRKVIGRELPFTATFVHSGAPSDRFEYRYTEVLPFRVAPGSPSIGDAGDPATLFDRLGDLREIAAAHERVMAAHRASDAEMMTAADAELTTVSGRGRLTEVKRSDQLERMRAYLGAIRFSRYEDTVVPVISLSRDGSLAWLACEQEAEGVRTVDGRTEPIAYAFSWVELYARDTGASPPSAWRAIGNASSLRP